MHAEDIPPELGIKAKRFLLIDDSNESEDKTYFTVNEILIESEDLKTFFLDERDQKIFCYSFKNWGGSINQSGKNDFRNDLVRRGFRNRKKVGGISSSQDTEESV